MLNYQGDYTVELFPDSPTDKAPQDAIIEKKGDKIVVSVKHGRIRQSMGGIDLYSQSGQAFYWGYKFMRRILNAQGAIIWQNQDVQN